MNTVGYKVYRKAGSSFASATNPSADGTLLTNTPDTLLTYTDLKSGGLAEGTTYYYTVCAYDRANLESGTPAPNTTCDGTVRNYTIPDTVAPVISGVAASPLLPNKTNQPFSVGWSVSDNIVANGSIWVVVYRTVTPSASTATTAAGVYASGYGLTSVTGQVGTNNADEYFNYLIVASDPTGNSSQTTHTVKSDRINPSPSIASPAAGTITRALHYEVVGTCEYGATVPITASISGAGAQVVSSSCSAGGTLSAKILLPDGGTTHTLSVTNTDVYGNSTTLTRDFVSIACPTGYVGVPGKWSDDADVNGLGLNGDGTNSDSTGYARAGRTNAGYDPTRDFCIMKYPAKVATSNNGGQQAWEPVYDGNKDFITGSAPTIAANYWPESRADSTPWLNITRDEAIDRCKALNEASGHCSGAGCYSTFDNTAWGYRLISNTQWQVIARNLEANGANWTSSTWNGASWTSGTAGAGYLWRGHSDNIITAANTDLFSQTYAGATQKSLSNPKSDTGNSDYFGTGNDATQNGSNTSGWQERRRFVLSSGASVWDFVGNVWEWMSDNRSSLGIPAEDETSGMATNAFFSYLNGGVNRFSASGNLIFGGTGSGGVQFSEAKNSGQVTGSTSGGLIRSGAWYHGGYAGLFTISLNNGTGTENQYVGFRCVFVPPIPSADTNAPAVTGVQRTDTLGTAVSNGVVTVASGGSWNLAWTVSDAENTGVNANKIFVQVRRKVASSSGDFPVIGTDAVYKSGYKLNSLLNETAWVQNASTGQYSRNDSKYVNYLVTAIDPAGNMGSATYSVYNEQSCPPGYVGVPGNNTNGLGLNGDGTSSDSTGYARAGRTNRQLDPSYDFCVMKYPAKVMSAGTTAAQTTVGGLFEPIMNGNNTFTNTYTYTAAPTFAANVKYLPESRSSGTPWVKINRDDSISACRALQMQYFGELPSANSASGLGFQLISNTQWQVVARNAEAVGANWSGNAVGTGVLNRGHSDNIISATEATNSWCFGCTAPSTSLSGAPNSISDANYYFATGNTSATAWNMIGTSPAAGAEQKRTHTLSNGVVTWDFGGNVWQWVSDNRSALGISGADDTAGLTTASWQSFLNGGVNRFSATGNLIFGNLGSGGRQFSEAKNAGQFVGGSAVALVRGGYGGEWFNPSGGGLFGANLSGGPTGAPTSIGFRCVYVPPPSAGSVSGYAPQITALGRVNDLGDYIENSAVTIEKGGLWNLKWALSDVETASASLAVEVRRKITSSATDFPTTSDSVYTSGNGLAQLRQETAWASVASPNNNTYVNYLITATDAHGNTTSRTISVQNTKSCPTGYVGVPGNSTNGLGNASATVGNADPYLDPSRAFCVMKYPAKNVSSAAASVAAGTPWVSIDRPSSATACSSLGTGFGLISNTQWQVVARNAESVNSNWSGGAVGTGVLNCGHSDGSPNGGLANSSDDSDGYYGTSNVGFTSAGWSSLGASPAAGAEQKRTHNLSNGIVVWDFAGNVWSNVSDNRSALGIPAADDAAGMSTNALYSYLNGGVNRFSATGNLIFGNLGSGGVQFSESNNAGMLVGGSAGAMIRGGHWGPPGTAGLFAASLFFSPSSLGPHVGFRCVFIP